MEENWDDDARLMTVSSNQSYETSNVYYNSSRNAGHRENTSQRTYNTGTNHSRQRNRQNNYRNEGSNNSIIHVDTVNVGKLIGRGGSTIKHLQEQSNARIMIDRNSRGETTAVTLSGSEDAQQQAKGLIEDLLSISLTSNAPNQHVNHVPVQRSESPILDFTDFDWSKANEECERIQAEKWAKLPPVIKNFYHEDPAVANMSHEYIAQIRENNNNIEVQRVFSSGEGSADDTKIPNPVETFEQAFRSYPDILEEIQKQGFQKPSPIQCQAWPILLSGIDLIGIAQTGTGKTLAFLLPALIHIDGQVTPRSERTGPSVLILAPTRELALQIEKEVGKYSYHGINAICVYGGGDRTSQIKVVQRGVEIVIATPGRLNDLINNNYLDIAAVTYLVLDEADRMLDMGFEPQIRRILLNIRPERQTIMTSATWPQGVRRLAETYMKNPIQVSVGSLDLAAVHTVTQRVFIVEDHEKDDMLAQFFEAMAPDDKVIVFMGKKSRVDDLSSNLALKGVNCQSIHGGRDQADREQALEDIKRGEVQILLATDVASRGIDIEDITHVFNYDFPRDIEEYVHRVGRTGRAGRSGESITLMTWGDRSHANELIHILEKANQEVPKQLRSLAQRYETWREKRAAEKDLERRDAGGNSGRGGGRNDGGRRNRWRNDF